MASAAAAGGGYAGVPAFWPGKSYRLKEAQERTARKTKSRTAATRKER